MKPFLKDGLSGEHVFLPRWAINFHQGVGGFVFHLHSTHSWSPNGQVLSMRLGAFPLAHPLTLAWVWFTFPPVSLLGYGWLQLSTNNHSRGIWLHSFCLGWRNKIVIWKCSFFKCMLHCLSYCVLLGVVHIRIGYSLNKLRSLNFSGGHVKDLNFPSFWALEATFTVLFMFLNYL